MRNEYAIQDYSIVSIEYGVIVYKVLYSKYGKPSFKKMIFI